MVKISGTSRFFKIKPILLICLNLLVLILGIYSFSAHASQPDPKIKVLNLQDVDQIIKSASTMDDEIIGEGLWGKVIDLNDGSLLKLIHRKGGTNKSYEIYAQEVEALNYFSGFKSSTLQVPHLVSTGLLDQPQGQNNLKTHDYIAWIQITKIEGRALSEEFFEDLSKQESQKIARSLGNAIAQIHNYARNHKVEMKDRETAAVQSIHSIAEFANKKSERDLCAQVIKALVEVPVAEKNLRIHGDIKLSNIIVDEKLEVIGLIDFADSTIDFKEMDFSHVSKHPGFVDEMVKSYNKTALKPVNQKLLYLAIAVDALLTSVLENRLGDAAASTQGKKIFQSNWQLFQSTKAKS